MNSSRTDTVNMSNSESSTAKAEERARSSIMFGDSSIMAISKKEPLSSMTSELTTSKKQKKKRNKSNNKRPEGKPTRPLSAYNIFFRSERERMIASREQGDKPAQQRTGISFENLAKTIASKWRTLDSTDRQVYETGAAADRERYRSQKEAWRATDAGREYELEMKKARMERAGAKFADFTFGLPTETGHPHGDGSTAGDALDNDSNLTPLQRMFQRGDAMVQHAEKKRKLNIGDSHQVMSTASRTTPSVVAGQVELNTVATSEVAKDQVTGNCHASPPLSSHQPSRVEQAELTAAASWAQETKVLLTQGKDLLQVIHNRHGGHSVLEAHSKKVALSADAGFLTTRHNNGPMSDRVAKGSISERSLLDELCESFNSKSDEAGMERQNNFLNLDNPSTGGCATRTNAITSASSHNSIDTINSLTNLLGSNQSIQGLLSASNLGTKQMPSAESLKMILSVNEIFAMNSSDSLCEILRNSPLEAASTEDEHISCPAPESPRGLKRHLSLRFRGRADSSRSKPRMNASWPSHPSLENAGVSVPSCQQYLVPRPLPLFAEQNIFLD